MKLKTILRMSVLLLLIALVIFVTINYRAELDLHKLQNTLAQYGPLAPLVFIGLYILSTICFLPGLILTIAGGLLFGLVLGTLYNVIGATLGATSAFLIGRYLAADWIKNRPDGKIKILLRGVKKEGWRFVAVTRLIPIVPYNLLNYALGVTGIGLVPFVVASIIFMLPGTIAYTYIGSLGETFIYGNARQIVTKVMIAIGLLVLLSVMPWIVKLVRSTFNAPKS